MCVHVQLWCRVWRCISIEEHKHWGTLDNSSSILSETCYFFFMNNDYFMYFPLLLTCTMGLTFTRRKSHVQGDIGIQSLSSMETHEDYSLIRVRVKVVSPFCLSMYSPTSCGISCTWNLSSYPQRLWKWTPTASEIVEKRQINHFWVKLVWMWVELLKRMCTKLGNCAFKNDNGKTYLKTRATITSLFIVISVLTVLSGPPLNFQICCYL